MLRARGRGKLAVCIAAAAFMVAPLGIGSTASAATGLAPGAGGLAAVDAPTGVSVDAPDLTATVSWTPPDDGTISSYRVEIRDGTSGAINAVTEVPSDQDSTTITDLPLWFEQVASVTAVYSDGGESAAVASVPFRILATLSLADSSPIYQDGDGPCCDQHIIRRDLQLDAPMPVDVWVWPTVLSVEGNERHDGIGRPDELWPVNLEQGAIKFPAGETTAQYTLYWGADEWRRFEWAHWTYGFRMWHHPNGVSGELHVGDAIQEMTMVEEDQDVWPGAAIEPEARVQAGQTARVRVRLNVPVRRKTVLTYRLRSATAQAGHQFGRRGTPVVFERGERTAWVTVPTFHTGVHHPTRFYVELTGARRNLARITGRATAKVKIRP